MSDATPKFDIATDHYRVLSTDPAARAAMIADPKQGLRDHFGYVADGDYNIEVIDEAPGVITILLPARPPSLEDLDTHLAEISGRTYDILLSETGLGGVNGQVEVSAGGQIEVPTPCGDS
jgi:hypothetical protein